VLFTALPVETRAVTVSDLVYVIRPTAGRGTAFAERLRGHAEHHGEIVARALRLLDRDFDAPNGPEPSRAADFMLVDPRERDADAAVARGFVDDLLRAYRTGA
jgi:hypothetical protein